MNGQPKILITRPEPDATATAKLLQQRGYGTLLNPLLDIVPRDPDQAVDSENAQAILVTSVNGARSLERYLQDRDDGDRWRQLPVFAVGDTTAQAMTAIGFASVQSARGDVAALAELAAGRLDKNGGPAIYVSGETVSGNLDGRLCDQGYRVERLVLYTAAARNRFAPPTVEAIAGGQIAAALLYSRRTALLFGEAVSAADLSGRLGGVLGVCISPAVAAAARAIGFGRLDVAATPNEWALLDCLDRQLSR